MKHCTVCGLEKDKNPAHGSEFKGVGQHSFKSAEESQDQSSMDDIIVSFGGELKSLGEDRFEGYLVRFSSADDPDLVGDYFTKSTEFFIEDGATIPLLYDHGLNATMKKTKIGRATVAFDDAGLFIKGELKVAENFKKFLKEIKEKLVDAGKAGLSSGAASHMVHRKQIKKGINEILSWGIAEGSVTPAPTEPRCEVVSLKSYFENREDPLTEEEVEQPLPPAPEKKAVDTEEPEEELAASINRPLKALFEEKLKEKVPSVWELRQTLDDVYKDIAMAASITNITDTTIDIETKIKEAKTEEAAREIPLVIAQVNKWVENGGSSNSDGGSKYFYLRSLPDTTELSELSEMSIKGSLANGLTLDEHSDRVVHAVEEYANLGTSISEAIKALEERCIRKIEYRVKDPIKSGRTLSKATLNKIASLKKSNAANIEKQQELDKSLDALIALADPKKPIGAAEVLSMEFALAQTQTEMALQGIPIS